MMSEVQSGSLPVTDADALPPVAPPATIEEERYEGIAPAELPQGLLRQVDYVIQHPDSIRVSLRDDADLWKLAQVFFLITVVMSACYGAVMGGTNWLQGSHVPWSAEFLFMIATGFKVPVLLLGALAIVLPPIYVSSTFVGARATFSQMTALLLLSLAITATVLASMAPVAFFFSLTTRSYDFIKLLHVIIFVYAGLAGMAYMFAGFRTITAANVSAAQTLRKTAPANPPVWLYGAWLFLYAFVGTQLAWVMRPFVGNPDLPFQLFRVRSGNFYENLFYTIITLLD
jgi:hypothetical protein